MKALTEGLNMEPRSFMDFATEMQKRSHKLVEELIAKNPDTLYQDAMNTAIFLELGKIYAKIQPKHKP